MNNQIKHHKDFTIYDLEELLRTKNQEDFSETEWKVLLQFLGSKAQIRAYQSLLQNTMQILDAKQSAEITPRASTQSFLRQKLKARQTQRNSIDYLLTSFLALFYFPVHLRSSIAIAMLAIAFWYGGQWNEHMTFSTDTSLDSIAMHHTNVQINAYDTTCTSSRDTNAARNGNSVIKALPFRQTTGRSVADSFALHGILRQ